MSDPMRYRLEHDPLIIEQVVTWGDNVVYFRYMENARVEFYRRIGKYELKFLAPRCQEFRNLRNGFIFLLCSLTPQQAAGNARAIVFEERTGSTLVVKSTGCRYIASLSCPDRISIGARVTDMNDEEILMQYIIVNTGTNQVAALGEAAIVALQAWDSSRVVFPEELKARIRELQPERT